MREPFFKKGSLNRFSAVLIVLLFLPGLAGAVEVSARVTPEMATIGDRLAYEIAVTDAGDMELPQTLEPLAPFELLNVKTVKEGKAKKIVFTLTTFKTGKHKLPPYSLPVAGKPVSAPAVTVEIVSVLNPDVKEPQLADIEPVADAPVEKSEYLLWLGIALAVLAVIGALYWYLKKRKPVAAAFPPAPPLLPSDAALNELARIKGLFVDGDVKGYFSGISDALRNYLFAEYGLDAPEKTTNEIERSWIPLLERERDPVAALLRLCDAVKFAKAHPAAGDAEQAYAEAVRFIKYSPKVKSRPPLA
ncbi:MAG: hypothetical protein HZA04_08545 [Nitrospinae bacterium]|nr:hypothetical protein [Nitrospinota bacterium]